MKSKIKKFINSKLFIFIITALVFSTIGVSAATYFESNLVTYDNTESGLQSTNVQGAIDELYNACKTPSIPAGEYILENIPIITVGEGLYEDEYQGGRYIFKGGNPNNYITFNNEEAGWRIISIEPDKTLKIMKINNINTSINLAWDDTNSNNWRRPATLNTYLNGTYYNSLSSEAQRQIVAKDWSIGRVTEDNNNLAAQINNENSAKWNGKVALATVSEYIRANSDTNNCGTYELTNINSFCTNTGWMDDHNYWWTLTPSGAFYNAFYIYASKGDIYISSTQSTNRAVRPVIYISSKVQIIGGTGTSQDPYTIE